MENIFLKLLNMSITAGWLVLALLLFRIVFKRAPKWINASLWILVAIRLVCPFSPESIFSLIPSAETVPEDIMYSASPQIHSGIEAFNSTVNPFISESLAPTVENSANPMQIWVFIACVLWLSGVFAMLLYSVISYAVLRKRVGESIALHGNVRICDRIESPFILGIIKPIIYLPSRMEDGDMEYVIAHENAHLKRGDHLWKPFGFLLLSIYWFNPLLWVGYVLLCRDIELACDEKVIRELGADSKKPYSQALVNCSASHRAVAACPLAFGETGVKQRIRSVLSYKKPALWIIIAALTVSAVLALCFLTNPKDVDGQLSQFIDRELSAHNVSKDAEGVMGFLDRRIIGTKTNFPHIKTVYMWVLYEEYSFDGKSLACESGSHTLTAITVEKEKDGYRLLEYWTPRDGSYYAADIRAKVPWYVYGKAIDSQRYIEAQSKSCRSMAERHFGIATSVIGGADSPTGITVTKELTLEKVISLSKKGEKLKWSDLDGYTSYETGSGLYIRNYPIDDMFYLSVGGMYPPDSEHDAIYFYLKANDGTDAVIDIRHGDVQAFIELHKDNPVVAHISAGWHLCPVGPCEPFYEEFTRYWGMPRDPYVSHILYLPVMEINSVSQLAEFERNMEGLMDFSLSYPDKDEFTTPSFDQIKKEYTEDFFKGSSLFLVYISSGAPERYTAERITLCDGKLSFGIKEALYASTDTAASGWLMCISVSKDQIKGASDVSAYRSSADDRDNTLEKRPVSAYVYTGSGQVTKPSVMFFRDGTFQLNGSPADSALYMGGYQLIGERLILCEGNGSVFVFTLRDGNMVFDREASSELPGCSIPDGAVFEEALPYEPTVLPD